MRVVSLFDGCGMAMQALKNLKIPLERYEASEIDKYAIQIAMKNHPEIIQVGDVTQYAPDGEVDLLIGGSPCQDLSKAGKIAGIHAERSGLFWEYIRILEQTKPDYFILENVFSMSKKNKDIISSAIGVNPVVINSALVSAQSRKRCYWTNIEVEQPTDLGIVLKDIVEHGVVNRDKSYCIDTNYWKGTTLEYYINNYERQVVFIPDRIGELNNSLNGKSVTLSASSGGISRLTGLYLDDSCIRKLTPVECERLQTLPDNYTEGVSNMQRYKMIGSGFTVKVIEHIISGIK